ncbi:hypothetical protein [uncultured Amaricoccus sp.]|uniref:hypothetical protein n=1 Tax=uncultured Amaricoccus sp. TaxID=339341 RepID=UPI002605082C|nr:hypothetical protein [uncultured Amaricoccus sp.]
MANRDLRLIDWRAERRRNLWSAVIRALGSEFGTALRLALGVAIGIMVGSLACDWLLYAGLWPMPGVLP